MEYSKALKYIHTLSNVTKPDLSRIQKIAMELGQPQLKYNTLHIAGTNGKSTTSRIINQILQEKGYRVGLYLSPYLNSYLDQILINSKPITKEDFASLIDELMPFLKKHQATLFEATTGLAYCHFAKNKVDYAIFEAGMGGKWDATNLIQPKIVAITNVELDHTDMLGKTLIEIAREKSGIIKEETILVTTEKKDEILDLFEKTCHYKHSIMRYLGRDFDINSRRTIESGQVLNIKGYYGMYFDLELPLFGKHNAENATLALSLAEALFSQKIENEALSQAFRNIRSPGRMEVIAEYPMVILDGAHNPHGARNLRKTIEEEFLYQSLILVISVLKDKDVDGILENILPIANEVVATENSNPRCLSAEKLVKKCQKINRNIHIKKDCKKAIDLAFSKTKLKDCILITGSLYTIGEVRDYIVDKKKEHDHAIYG